MRLSKKTKRKLAIRNGWTLRTSAKLLAPSLGLSSDPTFCLTRVLGNDLWPRHSKEQTVNNLGYFLNTEPDFPNTLRHFVLNRITSPERQKELEGILSTAGASFDTIPFDPEVYANIPFDFDIVGGLDFFESNKFADMHEQRQNIARIMTCHKKINYAMNVNGARNLALDHGRKSFDWTLPWDGACTMSVKGFEALAKSCKRYPNIAVRVVPMVRMKEETNEIPDFAIKEIAEEPQLVFNRSTSCVFDERFPYGIRDKTELLTRLGILGDWTHYKDIDFLPKLLEDTEEKFDYLHVKTAAIRLPSGKKNLDTKSDQKARASNRSYAILQTIRNLDETHSTIDEKIADKVYAKD